MLFVALRARNRLPMPMAVIVMRNARRIENKLLALNKQNVDTILVARSECIFIKKKKRRKKRKYWETEKDVKQQAATTPVTAQAMPSHKNYIVEHHVYSLEFYSLEYIILWAPVYMCVCVCVAHRDGACMGEKSR